MRSDGPKVCDRAETECTEELFPRQIQWGQTVDVHIKFPAFQEKLRQSAKIKMGIQATVYTDPGCS